ncbi:MAG TPA: FUSC family protein [Marmoricola sp.]|nr:FUSC family protein [Marmoricola sp.]
MSRAGQRSRVLPLWRVVAQHPQVVLAVKVAVAVGLAWLVVQALPGFAQQYPYYAPLGALIAVSGTVAGSLRESAQAIVAILLGAPIAWLVDLAFPTNVATLAAVVALATLASRWSWLGTKAGWAPVAALFVMLVGGNQPGTYVAAYLGLTSLGAVIGFAVDLAFPALPLNATQCVVTRLRETLADQLDDLAEGLLREQPLTLEEWNDRQREISPLASQMRRMVDHTDEARRGNWRAARWRGEAQRQHLQAQAMEELAAQVRDMTGVVTREERAELDAVALGPAVRPYAAHTLEAMADTLRSVQGSTADPELLHRADEALRRLVVEIRSDRSRTGDDMFGAGELVMTLRRALAALAPEDLDEPVPSRQPAD